MAVCTTPIGYERLTDYWAGDLDPASAELVEAHLFACDACTRALERIAVLAETIRGLIPAFVPKSAVDLLRARGLNVKTNIAHASERRPAWFEPGVDILLHVLSGLDLLRAERVDVRVYDEVTGAPIDAQQGVPFERDTGEIFVACQRHFDVFPPNVAFEVKAVEPGAVRVTTFVIPHQFVE